MQDQNSIRRDQTVSFATEGTRRVTGVAKDTIPVSNHPTTDPEVQAKAKRRQFSKAYKLRILDQWDKCSQTGQKAALLRREGLYSQTIANWIKQRKNGNLKATGKTINTSRFSPADKQKLMRLEIENEKLKANLSRAENIIELQKKIAELINLPPIQEVD